MWGPINGLKLDLGEGADLGPCPDCGKAAHSVWGYVSKNGNAHAAYYACWTEGHLADRGLQILVSIGRWGEGTNGGARRMVGLECRMQNARPSFMIVDASKVDIVEEDMFGRGLTREEVMQDPIKNDAFAVADHVTFSDQRIKDFLTGSFS